MNPQHYDTLLDKLFDNEAIDVFFTQVSMKKNRPAIKLSVITENEHKETLKEIIFRNTTSIGIREKEINRTKLKREIKFIDTKWGKVRVKLSFIGEEIIQIQPEYDDLKKISINYNVPIKRVTALISSITVKNLNILD